MIRKLLGGALTLVALTFSQQTYAQETIKIRGKKYHITEDKAIYDEKENRVTNQRTLRTIIQTYLLSQELPEYKKQAKKTLKEFNRTRTLAQLEKLLKTYARILKRPAKEVLKNLTSPSLPAKARIVKSLVDGTVDELIDPYINPEMYIYGKITRELQREQKNYQTFIRLVDKVDLTDSRNAYSLLELLIRSEPVIKASTYTFKRLRKSKNPKLKTKEKDKKEFTELLKQKPKDKKEELKIRRKMQNICDRVRKRAEQTTEARLYGIIKQQTRNHLIEKFLEDISTRFNQESP